MRIAVTYQMGQIFQHFGHTEYFKIYDAENGEVTSSKILPTNGSGHGALASFLADNEVDVLICGGIGQGAKNALSEKSIQVYGGVTGMADSAVKAFLGSALAYDPNACCNHHDHSHGNCGEHSCGDHKCHE